MQGIGTGIVSVLLYFIICATSALTLRVCTTVEDELFRKILHSILLGSLFVWTVTFPNWWSVSITAVIFAVLVYPILWFAERYRGYSKLVTERKSGELKSSLLIVFFMFAVVIAICWGYFGDRMLALASIYAWGFGDAAAALVGKRFGKHKICGKKKSVEGTAAMFAVSFVSVLSILSMRGGMDGFVLVLISFAVAAISAATELYTPNGLDTITCPMAAMAVLLPLVHLFGGV